MSVENILSPLRYLQEDSSLFQGSANAQWHRTIDNESVHIKGLVGKGGFANVNIATVDFPTRRKNLFGREKSSRKCAIKSLRRSLRESLVFDGAIDLAKEAMFLGALRHPHIINLYGTAKNPGRSDYFLVIEPLPFTLADRLQTWSDEAHTIQKSSRARTKEFKRCLLHTRLASILGIASALEYLHENNIVYRDLKPDNIGFDKYDTVKMFDFGLAKELKEVDRVGEDQYHATKCIGTPRYMPNEVFYGDPYGLPVDVFAFALILYEVVALKKAFPYNNMRTYVENVYEREKRPKLDRSLQVPREVKKWITKGWRHNPSARPKMSKLCRDMNAYMAAKDSYCSTSEGSFHSI